MHRPPPGGERVKLTQKDVTPALKSSVNAYLMARAMAEVTREKVNEVYQEVLQIHPLYEDLDTRARKAEPSRIYDPDKMYLSTDEETCSDVYADADFTLRERNIKPGDMPRDHCPALVAECVQRDTEHLIIETAAEMLAFDIEPKEFGNKLLCLGLEKYQEFINLCVGLVVKLPDFKNPLTGGR